MKRHQKIFKQFLGFFPSALPIGVTEFKKFSSDIIATYDLPDFPSYHHAIASQIMHFGPLVTKMPKRHFAKSIRKAMSNEIAFQVMQDIKKQELEKKREIEARESQGIPEASA